MISAKMDAILKVTLQQVSTLALILNGANVPLAIKKIPKREQQIDPPTQITISEGEPGPKTKPLCANPGGGKIQTRVDYPVVITLISPNNDDQTGNLQAYLLWYEQVRLLFKDKSPYASVTSVWDTQVEQGVFLSRKEIPKGYDLLQTLVTVTTVE